ncbi:hypothetical protein Rhe02_17930 [Rhizocola hellebori]|uniref:Uncharacterized protein n=1 Tax=Rhizocola hellebori TaxID=1392758 RepID=A0A8J3Q5J1_9ACTN|nr:peptidase [Rhizocola hellebori]GIH03726.1 hypothetical protein Rhe02_17930 [Rhizocola hellebori]
MLIASVTVCGAAPARATSFTPDRADLAASWLARQMTDGQRFEDEFGGVVFPNQSLTVDAVFAFATAKTAGDYGARAMAWLARPEILSGYAGDGTFTSYAGTTAKLALAAQVRGIDPASFGGVDLIGRLRELQQPSGRFSDRSPFGEFSNIFTQSFALLALDRTAAGAPPAASSFLVAARCADGGYPLLFGQPTCVSEVDTTAMAVQALIAVGRHSDAAVSLRWLVSVQHADGGFGNYSGVGNATSTGLAGQALRAGGRIGAAIKARSFLIGLQGGRAADPGWRGAIPNTAGFFDPFTTARATALAILGLAGFGFPYLTAHG